MEEYKQGMRVRQILMLQGTRRFQSEIFGETFGVMTALLKDLFPGLYALVVDKEASVAGISLYSVFQGLGAGISCFFF